MRTRRRSAGIRPGAALAAAAVGLVLAGAREAWAYVDPGTGSYVLQTLVAGALGAAFAVKTFWGSIKAWLSRSLGKGKRPPDAP